MSCINISTTATHVLVTLPQYFYSFNIRPGCGEADGESNEIMGAFHEYNESGDHGG
jgi:hypothetical protein